MNFVNYVAPYNPVKPREDGNKETAEEKNDITSPCFLSLLPLSFFLFFEL